ncbi:hypothetical protein Aperf_G00000012685 [Anoplocephala perfoliata]
MVCFGNDNISVTDAVLLSLQQSHRREIPPPRGAILSLPLILSRPSQLVVAKLPHDLRRTMEEEEEEKEEKENFKHLSHADQTHNSRRLCQSSQMVEESALSSSADANSPSIHLRRLPSRRVCHYLLLARMSVEYRRGATFGEGNQPPPPSLPPSPPEERICVIPMLPIYPCTSRGSRCSQTGMSEDSDNFAATVGGDATPWALNGSFSAHRCSVHQVDLFVTVTKSLHILSLPLILSRPSQLVVAKLPHDLRRTMEEEEEEKEEKENFKHLSHADQTHNSCRLCHSSQMVEESALSSSADANSPSIHLRRVPT